MNTIQLVELDPSIRTSYVKGRGTRDQYGQIHAYDDLMSVGDAPYKSMWTASAGTAKAVLAADKHLKSRGVDGLRVTEAIRSVNLIITERKKLDNWHDAGSPERDSPRFNLATMRTTYLCAPNETHHQWGGAVDLDIGAIRFPDIDAKDHDGQLAALWEVLGRHGLIPIIGEPRARQSEAWHFQNTRALQKVRAMFAVAAHKDVRYCRGSALTATVACILAGKYLGGARFERHVQALLLIGGFWIGLPDGDIGKMTRAGLEQAGIRGASLDLPASTLIALLTEKGVGAKVLAKL